MWFQIEGRLNNNTWKEYLENNKWLYKHKHNKFKHRSGMSNMEKYNKNKIIRREGYKNIIDGINEINGDN